MVQDIYLQRFSKKKYCQRCQNHVHYCLFRLHLPLFALFYDLSVDQFLLQIFFFFNQAGLFEQGRLNILYLCYKCRHYFDQNTIINTVVLIKQPASFISYRV